MIRIRMKDEPTFSIQVAAVDHDDEVFTASLFLCELKEMSDAGLETGVLEDHRCAQKHRGVADEGLARRGEGRRGNDHELLDFDRAKDLRHPVMVTR